MAAGTSAPPSGGPNAAAHDVDGKLIEFDRYIESQIHRTRRQVKGVDLSTSLMVLAVGTLVYLMLVAMIDHWLVSGGLGFAGRLTAFLLLATGLAGYAAARIAPLLLRRINPVYAAHTIERSRPGIKNSLINFLLLRSSPAGLSPRVYEAMEAQAVNALTSVHSDVPVDRGPVIRLMVALLGIVTCLALYAIVSPKSPFASFRRVVAPWADVAPPTRVRISDVQPGDATGFHDQHVAVSAEVSGVRSGEGVTLYYSSLDAQVVQRAVPMTVPESSYRYAAELPPDSIGLQQDLEYWIEAGDAISPHHHIKVETPPSIVVDTIDYEFPKYTELPPQRVSKQGDIQALEGTRISLAAAANQHIRRADLDFECDGRNDLTMKIDGRRANVAFALGLDAKTQRPEHESYQLRFINDAGHENPKPIRYTIDVIRDLPPEIALVEPTTDPVEEIPLKAGASLRLTVQASDPDFKLAAVKLHARRSGLRLLDEKLLAEPRAGQFTRDYMLDSRKLGLKPGETVEFWASADDNKQPQANRAETPHYTLRIVSPDARPQPGQADKNDRQQPPGDRDQQPRDGQPNQPAEHNGDQEQQQDQQQDQQQGEQGNQGGAQGERKNQPPKNAAQGDQGEEGNEGGRTGQKSENRGKNGAKKETGNENAGEPNEGSQEGRQGEGEGGGRNGQSQQPSDEQQRVDPNRDPGKAFEKILEHLNQNQQPGDKDQQKQRQPEGAKSEKPEKSDRGDQSQSSAGQQQGSQQEQGSDGRDRQQGEAQRDQQGSDQQPINDDQRPGDKGADAKGHSGDKSSAAEKDENQQQGDQDTAAGRNQKKSGGSSKESAGGEASNEDRLDLKKGGNANQGKASQGDSPQDGAGGEPDKKQDAEQPQTSRDPKETASGEQGDAAEGEHAKGQQPRSGGKVGQQPSDGQRGKPEKPGEMNNEGAPRKPQVGQNNDSKRESHQGDEGGKHADGEQEPQQGKGDQATGSGEPDEKNAREHGPEREHQGGDPDSKDKGDGGAGQEGESRKGGATPMNPMQPKDKKQTSPAEKKQSQHDEDPAALSESKKSSDSQGEQSGDKAGGGNSSGGQRSNSPGVGSAGQNTASENGGGQSEEKGKGATGTRGGDQTKGEQPTDGGKASDEKGPGSHQRQGGKKAGGPDQAPPPGADLRGHSNDEPAQPRDESSADRENSDQPKQGQAGGNEGAKRKQMTRDSQQRPGGQPTPSDKGGNDVQPGQPPSAGRANPSGGGGPPGDPQTAGDEQPDNSEPGGDDPKLEYTRKATDLVLDRLQDQMANDKVDPELLEKLKWTPEDLQRFMKQWQQLRQAADESGPRSDAARELDEALRSLGLRPRGAALKSGQPGKAVSGLREGQRTAPPPEYREQYREFSKAKAKGLKKPR